MSGLPTPWYLLVLAFLGGTIGLASAYTLADWIAWSGPMIRALLGGVE